ncbi:alanine--tRNA ligase, partial [bacterium]|nr:alanine--tRNA ligase [bacterium]
LPEEKMFISVFKEDDEAEEIWKKIGVSSSKIVRLGEKDNFWKMGETGPCGPCSEILYDQGEEFSCQKPTCAPGCDCDRYLELWNLVFTQFDRDKEGNLTPLPKKNIDTGMGLERLAAVMQGAPNNFETDLLFPIIEYAASLSKVRYGQDKARDTSLKIIADHLRAVTFLVFDGVLPSNEGRGYVLRSILRRAMRQGRKIGLEDVFLYQLAAIVTKTFEMPSLDKDREHIAKIVKLEEERFLETLGQGSLILDEMVSRYKSKGEKILAGAEVFKLYDTYGFPLELTIEMAKEKGLGVDTEGFRLKMDQQRQRARKAGLSQGGQQLLQELNQRTETEFVGYERDRTEARILDIIKDSSSISEAGQGDEVILILDKTPFYAEAGGQAADTGTIRAKEATLRIVDVQKTQGNILHQAKVVKGKIKVKDKVSARVDSRRRKAIQRNHTATHLLQAALRKVLGKHVRQSGSLVDENHLRFDFTHLAPMKAEELLLVEEIVNRKAMEDISLGTTKTTLAKAKEMGATALFEDEYEEEVRAVKIGNFSLELCGGTHLGATGEIGLFKIKGETGIAAGTRRIEALTGEAAYKYVLVEEEALGEIASLLKVDKDKAAERIERLVRREKELEKEVGLLKRGQTKNKAKELASSATEIGKALVVAAKLDGLDIDDLREAADIIVSLLKGRGVAILASVGQDSILWVVKVAEDLIPELHAGRIIKEVAKIAGGGGGGRPDFAQAGGKNPAKAEEALEKGLLIIKERLQIR